MDRRVSVTAAIMFFSVTLDRKTRTLQVCPNTPFRSSQTPTLHPRDPAPGLGFRVTLTTKEDRKIFNRSRSTYNKQGLGESQEGLGFRKLHTCLKDVIQQDSTQLQTLGFGTEISASWFPEAVRRKPRVSNELRANMTLHSTIAILAWPQAQ